MYQRCICKLGMGQEIDLLSYQLGLIRFADFSTGRGCSFGYRDAAGLYYEVGCENDVCLLFS